MWTWSTMYTLRFASPARPRLTLCTRSRTLSTPLFDAASSSARSKNAPAAIATQFSHLPQGSESGCRSRQLSAFASRRAVDVFPVPRGPENRYA
jgi:hypothetical protein